MPAPGRPDPDKTCLFIQGTDGTLRRDNGRIRMQGNNDLDRLLGDPTVPMVILSADTLKRSTLPVVNSYRCLVNQISDPDCNPRMLEHLVQLLSGFKGRVINHPTNILKTSRDQVAKLLAGTPGLRVPKVVRLLSPDDARDRIEGAGLSFPLILRRTGTHAGRVLGLFSNIEDLLGSIPGDGELFATEFVDFRSSDGLYRKYRVCVYDRSIILRHLIISDEWNIHGADRKGLMLQRADLRDEERRAIERPRLAFPAPVLETLRAVRERMPLDYFGIDFGIDGNGSVVLFEANATMDSFAVLSSPEFAYGRAPLVLMRRALRAMIPGYVPWDAEVA